MKKNRGFTLIELLVVIAIIALLIGILVPALGAARRAANKMKNGTQITAIGKNLVLWSDAFYQQTQDFPKYKDAAGNTPALTPAPSSIVANFPAFSTNIPENKVAALLNMGNDVLAPTMIVNPIGTDIPIVGSIPTITPTPTNLSYGMLETLCVEWKNKVNSAAPIICDKQVIGANVGSFWNANLWEGNVGWGDTHVTYENPGSAGAWPNTTINGTANTKDNLFTGGGAGATSTDARMYNPLGGPNN